MQCPLVPLAFVTLTCIALGEEPAQTVPQEPDQAAPAVAGDVMEVKQDKLRAEKLRLDELRRELETLQNAPLPDQAEGEEAPANTGSSGGSAGKLAAPARSDVSLPSRAVPGAEEQLANTLYDLGEYKKARVLYEAILAAEPPDALRAWAMFQSGNCARKAGNHLAATKSYDELVGQLPESPWAAEAAWWAGEVKWWVLWRETRRKADERQDHDATPGATTAR
jgi:TolA-binding protein